MDYFSSGVTRAALDLSEEGAVLLSCSFCEFLQGRDRVSVADTSGPGHNLLAQGYQSSPGTASDLKSKLPLSAPGHCTRLRATYAHVHVKLEKEEVSGNFYLWGASQPVVLRDQRICSVAPSSQRNNFRRPLFHFLEGSCRREFPLPITHGGKLHDALLY